MRRQIIVGPHDHHVRLTALQMPFLAEPLEHRRNCVARGPEGDAKFLLKLWDPEKAGWVGFEDL
jgi:hypothetical protein